MPYPLDHLLIAVNDLDIAAESWRRMGFTPSPRMHHSYGTSNNLIMFQDNFLELFGGMDNVQGDFREGFISSMARSLARAEGVLANSFRPKNIEADRAVLVEQGVRMGECASFTRPVPLPSAAEGEAFVTYTMSEYAAAPDLRLFFSQQHRPEVVWIPEWQSHPNGAIRITGAAYLLEQPQAHEPIFSAFTGQRPQPLDGRGLHYQTPTEEIFLLDAEGLKARYGDVPGACKPHQVGRAAAIDIQVQSLATAREALTQGGFGAMESAERLILAPADTHGVILAFHE